MRQSTLGKWAVCPRLNYGYKLNLGLQPVTFATKQEATDFLRAPHVDEYGYTQHTKKGAYFGPVPVRRFDDFDLPSHAAIPCRFREYMGSRPIGPSQYVEKKTQLKENLELLKSRPEDEMLAGRVLIADCYLAEDWRFETHAEVARVAPEYPIRGEGMPNLAEPILRSCYALESALLEEQSFRHEALILFWFSWQVRDFIHRFVWDHLAHEANAKSLAGQSLDVQLRAAEQFVIRGLRKYVKYLDHLTAKSDQPLLKEPEQPRKRGRPPISGEKKLKAIEKLKEGGTYKDAASVLYGKKYPTRQDSRDAWKVLDYFLRNNPKLLGKLLESHPHVFGNKKVDKK